MQKQEKRLIMVQKILIEVFKINENKKSFENDQNLNYKLYNKNIFNFY